jgi:hypothetical protein
MTSTNAVSLDPSPRRIGAASKRQSSLDQGKAIDTAAALMMYDISGSGLPAGTDEPVLLDHEGLEYIPEGEEWHKPTLPPRSRCTATKMWKALADGSETPNPTPPVPSTQEADAELISNQSIAESLDGYSNADATEEQVRTRETGLTSIANGSRSGNPSSHPLIAVEVEDGCTKSDDDIDIDPLGVGGGMPPAQADDSISECMNSTFGEIPHFLELPVGEPAAPGAAAPIPSTAASRGAEEGTGQRTEKNESNEPSSNLPPKPSVPDPTPLRIDHTKHAMLYHDNFHNAAAFELQRRDALAQLKGQFGGDGEQTVVEDLLPDVDGYLLEERPTQYNVGATSASERESDQSESVEDESSNDEVSSDEDGDQEAEEEEDETEEEAEEEEAEEDDEEEQEEQEGVEEEEEEEEAE